MLKLLYIIVGKSAHFEFRPTLIYGGIFMKYKLRRTGKRTLSMVLAILMMISTLIVGTITSANADGGTIAKGTVLYFNFTNITDTSVGANYPGSNNNVNETTANSTTLCYNSSVAGKTIKVSFTQDVNFSASTQFLKTSKDWNSPCYYNPPASGQNMVIVSADGKSYTWGTYGGSSGGETGNTHTVYFKNTVNWSNVYVHFYTSEYWNSEKGTGCQNIAVVAENMTLVSGTTDVYSYKYTGDYSYVSFTEAKQNGYQYFNETKAAYRDDIQNAMSSGTPMYVPNTTSSGTKNSTVYYNNGEWEALKLDDTVTQISSLTEKKQTNKIIANSNTSSKAQSAWIWGTGDGKAYNLTEVGTASSQYLSYHTHSLTSPNAIFFQDTVTTSSWPSNTRITNKDVKASNGFITSADDHTSIIDGNYYFPVTSSTTDDTQFTVFDHIGGTITPNKKSITLGESITLTGAATAGTLRKAKTNAGNDKFTYVVRDSSGKYYRIGADKTEKTSVTWKPTVGGTYTICGLVTDPFGFESMKVSETTVTVNNPVQTKYTVTYSAGVNGSFTCKQDTTNVPSGSQVVENSSVKFTIAPAAGYEVDTFTVNAVNKKSSISNNTYTHKVTEDIDVKVTFKKTNYTVTVDSSISGGAIEASKATANMGDIITLAAKPNMGYFLKSITVTKAGGGTVDCSNNSFTMPAGNVTVSAKFITYRITGSITTAGTSETDINTSWDKFDKGISFDTLVKDGVYSKTITLKDSDLTQLRNKFRIIDNNNQIDSSSDNVVYRPDTSDCTVDNNKGYLITNKNSETNAYSTVNGKNDNYFYFDQAGEYTLYIKYVANGNPKIWVVRDKFNLTATNLTHCKVEFYSDSALTNKITQSKANETVYVKVTPDTNYEVETVKANSGVTLTSVAGKDNVYSFTMPGADVNVTATAVTIKQKITFSFLNSSLSVSYILNGTSHNSQTVKSGDTITVDKGKTLSINATLSAGYEAVTPTPWIITPAPTPAPTTAAKTCSFTVSGDATVTYNTKKIDYSITCVNNPTQGGTSAVKVNGNDVTKLNIGDKFTVDQTVNTAGGYEIASVVVKAGTSTLSPDPNGIYTMTTGNVTVTTTYKAIKPTISNCPTDTVKLYAGSTYTIPATTNYGTLSYSASPAGDFTFSGKVATAPNKEGTYTITVTATNKPTGITTAATTTATINVIVEFTETQKAYKNLENKFAEIGYEKKEYYDTVNHLSEWTAYENAVRAAETLLETFPSPTATNKTDYTNAQTTLQNAYNAIQPYKKVNTIYVLSKYAPESTSNKGYVNIYMFNGDTSESYEPVGNVVPIAEGSSAYAMTKLGTVKVNGIDKYLYKFEYFGKGDFIVYVGANSNSEITDSSKLTGNVTTCKGFTSYYLDLKDTSKTSIGYGVAHSGTIISPYMPLSVELTKTSDTCVEDTTYNLATKITKTEGGTLKAKSNVTVTHTYTDTLNGDTKEITSPTTWIPTEPGVHTITITSSTGVTDEDVTNTFTLYVQDKLDKPVISINGVSDSNLTVNNETKVTITVQSSGEAYPDGVKYVFTVDGKSLPAQSEPTLTYNEGELAFGDHTFSVKVIAPDTKIVGTDITQYVDSDVSDEKTVTVKTVKYTYNFDFSNCHISTNSVTYKLEGVDKTFTDKKGEITVDKNCTVTFTVTMSGNYKPIPNDNCWSVVTGATIGEDKLSYSFTATGANANSIIVFKSYLPAVLSPESQDIKIGTAATIKINELDSNANYQLLFKEKNDTEYSLASATLSGNVFTTSNLEYGKYNFKVRQYTDDYDVMSKDVYVNAVIGTIELKYYYKEYNDLNGLAYDPYIGKENNLKSTATEYSITLEEDMSKAITESGRADLYKQNAPNIHSNYFNYKLVTTGLKYEISANKSNCTISGSVMTPTERTYNVSINGVKENEFTSYYQQKTFLLDAANYCSEGTYGYVWYNVDSENNRTVVSTDQYYKLRVARDTNLYVEALDTEVKTPTTIINEPVYNEYTTDDNAVKVQMNMLVENYLPDDAVRTRTGVVYCAFDNGATPPTIDSTQLASLIAKSNALAGAEAGKTCTVGTLNGTVIKGYYTANDNVNGKFIFGPIAKIDSTKNYVVYSYLTYIQDNVSKTIISRPVTASVKMYKAESTPTT